MGVLATLSLPRAAAAYICGLAVGASLRAGSMATVAYLRPWYQWTG